MSNGGCWLGPGLSATEGAPEVNKEAGNRASMKVNRKGIRDSSNGWNTVVVQYLCGSDDVSSNTDTDTDTSRFGSLGLLNKRRRRSTSGGGRSVERVESADNTHNCSQIRNTRASQRGKDEQTGTKGDFIGFK